MILPIEERLCLCDNCWLCEEDAKITMEDLQRARDNWEEIDREAAQRLLDAIAEGNQEKK